MWVVVVAIVLILVGGISLAASAKDEDGFKIAKLYEPMGGIAVGAGLALLFAVFGPGLLAFFLADDSLDSYRREWHHYHVTQRNDELFWEHVTIDFSNSSGIQLETTVTFEDGNGAPLVYDVRAEPVGERFVVFITPVEGEEPASIEILPFMGYDFQASRSGIILHQTYDINHTAIQPAILSVEPIAGIVDPGRVESEHGEELHRVWLAGLDEIEFFARVPGEVLTGAEANGRDPR